MDCRNCKHDMWHYLKNNLNDRKTAAVLEHIDSCPSCREELKIQFMVSEGLKRLEDNQNGFNLVNDFNKMIDASKHRCMLLKRTNFVVMYGSLALLAYTAGVLIMGLIR